MTKNRCMKDGFRTTWSAAWGIAALLLIMGLAPATTMAYDVDGRIQNEMELAQGTADGIVCNWKNFKKASEVKGVNFNAWVYVEEPSLAQQLTELVQANSREIRIGWHWDTGMTKDAMTLRYTITEINSGEVRGPFYHVMGPITDQCTGVTDSVLVGGLEGRSVQIDVVWTFSGAQVTTVDTQGHIASVEVWAEAEYNWEVSAEMSATGPRAGGSVGGSVAYGGSLALQVSNTSAVSVHTITKSAIGTVWVGPGPVLSRIIPDAVPVDQTALALCVLTHNVERGEDADFCKPVAFESHLGTCLDIECIPGVPDPCDHQLDPCNVGYDPDEDIESIKSQIDELREFPDRIREEIDWIREELYASIDLLIEDLTGSNLVEQLHALVITLIAILSATAIDDSCRSCSNQDTYIM